MTRNKLIFALLPLVFLMSVWYTPVSAIASPFTEETDNRNHLQTAPIFDFMYDEPDYDTESIIPIGTGFRPFTPDGSGTVVDNATDGDGKEFFTIMTKDGNVFYLIIDRQRNTNNVYFLSAVTEEDLMSLAAQAGRTIQSSTDYICAIPTPEHLDTYEQGLCEKELPESDVEQSSGGGNSMILILIVIAGAGGAVYYFKVVKGKQNSTSDDEYDNGDEYGEYGDDDESDDEDIDNEFEDDDEDMT